MGFYRFTIQTAVFRDFSLSFLVILPGRAGTLIVPWPLPGRHQPLDINALHVMIPLAIVSHDTIFRYFLYHSKMFFFYSVKNHSKMGYIYIYHRWGIHWSIYVPLIIMVPLWWVIHQYFECRWSPWRWRLADRMASCIARSRRLRMAFSYGDRNPTEIHLGMKIETGNYGNFWLPSGND